MHNRFYRNWTNNTHLQKFNISYKETDLFIRANKKLPDLCLETVKNLRNQLDKYIQNNPQFYKSLTPIKVNKKAPAAVKEMVKYSRIVDVGPMAGVAGFFYCVLVQAVLKKTDEVIVENGGDIYLSVKNDPVIGIYAGKDSPFTGKIGVKISAEDTPIGICTSAGTIGPSLSQGKADAVIVLSPITTLADATATAMGNYIQDKNDIQKIISKGKKIENITGLLIIKDDNLGIWGNLELVKMN